MGYVCTALLTLDCLVRVLICPSLKEFIISSEFLCDGSAVCVLIGKHVVQWEMLHKDHNAHNWAFLLHVTELLILLRLYGLLMKVSQDAAAFQLLYL
jgi:hypothetical protein